MNKNMNNTSDSQNIVWAIIIAGVIVGGAIFASTYIGSQNERPIEITMNSPTGEPTITQPNQDSAIDSEEDDTTIIEPAEPVAEENLSRNDSAARVLQGEYGQEFNTGIISAEQVEEVLASVTLSGPENPELVIVEYSDFECPFCKRHNDSNTLNEVVESNDGVAKAFAHFPLSFHENAQVASEAVECIADQVGSERYFEFVSKVFDLGTPARSSIIAMLQEEDGINVQQVETCLDEGEKTALVEQNMENGQTYFRVSGTPGNVVLNPESGEFVLISGAYPRQAFETAIAEFRSA